jgi:HAT1-interacting factor 1
MRQEAAVELELSINSTKLKLQNKEVELASCSSPDENEITRKQIIEVKDIIADMEQRVSFYSFLFPRPERSCNWLLTGLFPKLVDLRAPPVDINAALNGPTLSSGGIIAATLGESPAEAHKRVEEAKKGAHDLTGLVRKKKVKADETETIEKTETATNGTTTNGNGKRKAEDTEETEAKKPKVD